MLIRFSTARACTPLGHPRRSWPPTPTPRCSVATTRTWIPRIEQARHDGDLTPLVETVRRWWFEADAWRDPEAQREFLARIERYQREGPPPPEQRITREEIRAQYGV